MSRSPLPGRVTNCVPCNCWRVRASTCPVTGIAHSPDDTSDLIDMVGGAPLVVKLVEGTQGIGVVMETRQAAESVIDAFRGLNAHILVQGIYQRGARVRYPLSGCW